MEQVKLWLEPLDERLFLEGKRQKILDEMKGKEPEKKLIPLINSNATEKLRKKDPKNYQENLRKRFQEIIKAEMLTTLKEKTLSKEEIEQLLVRKLVKLIKPNSEFDILLFRKVWKKLNLFYYWFVIPSGNINCLSY